MEEKAYKKAYLHLFNEITDTIEHLKEIQQQTEEILRFQQRISLKFTKTEKLLCS